MRPEFQLRPAPHDLAERFSPDVDVPSRARPNRPPRVDRANTARGLGPSRPPPFVRPAERMIHASTMAPRPRGRELDDDSSIAGCGCHPDPRGPTVRYCQGGISSGCGSRNVRMSAT